MVIYSEDSMLLIYVSGYFCEEELKFMYYWVKFIIVILVYGEY